jgi:putative toxin-antitoxin system antitoxin component (TIGR02293 family)
MTPTTRAIVEACGGRKAWRATVRTPSDAVREVRAGLPYGVLASIARDFRFDLKELVEVLDIPWSTLARRKNTGRYRPDESDRVYRLARVAAMAATVLEGKDRAARWLREPNRALGTGVFAHAGHRSGGRQVEAILDRIEHGLELSAGMASRPTSGRRLARAGAPLPVAVPSAIVPPRTNTCSTPLHADFRRIRGRASRAVRAVPHREALATA